MSCQGRQVDTRIAMNLADSVTPSTRATGAQFNSFVEISTDFSTEFLVLQGVPHYYKNSVEKSADVSTKLFN